jgi:hypothetical protein
VKCLSHEGMRDYCASGKSIVLGLIEFRRAADGAEAGRSANIEYFNIPSLFLCCYASNLFFQSNGFRKENIILKVNMYFRVFIKLF